MAGPSSREGQRSARGCGGSRPGDWRPERSLSQHEATQGAKEGVPGASS